MVFGSSPLAYLFIWEPLMILAHPHDIAVALARDAALFVGLLLSSRLQSF
jgi:hypothetical protein